MSDVIRVVDRDGGVGSGLMPVPAPEALSGGAVSIRDAVLSDMPFMDELQKRHKVAVGFMFTAQMQGHIEQGHVIVAEDALGRPVGYCVGVDKYFRREDTGVIYQMNIVPGRQRGLVGASLLKAMFERSAYGVRLFCCWCAQDLAANRFWEAMGFVPLAFRTGSRKKSWKGADGVRHTGPRIHIFWQKRIRAGDVGDLASGGTPWWFPSQTGSGAMREDRIVLPIPPGTHWSDAKPAVLPGVENIFGEIAAEREQAIKTLDSAAGSYQQSPEQKAAQKAERKAARAKARLAREAEQARSASVAAGGLRFGAAASKGNTADTKQKKKDAEKAAQEKVAKKNDPRLVAMARELRDRWQEHVVAQPGMLEDRQCGKYAVGRVLEGGAPHPTPSAGIEIVETMTPRRIDGRDGRRAGLCDG